MHLSAIRLFKEFTILPALLLLALSGGAYGQELTLRGPFSGNWYDPGQNGHGVQIEVVNNHEAVVAWYAWDDQENLLWLFGVGEIDGNTITATLQRFSGGVFPPGFDPMQVQMEEWGSVEIVFDDCNNGDMSWMPSLAGFTAGSMPLERLTSIEGRACGAAEAFETVVTYNLDAGPGRWEPLFAEYFSGATVETEAEWMVLPSPLSHLDGWMLAGTNVSDDLAMFLKAPLGGLMPDTEYQVQMDLTFATSVPQDCVGIGGSPGGSVWVKLGASGVEPMVSEVDGDFELNIDKGGQSQGGEDAVVAGNMTNRQQGCPDESEWQLKTVSTAGTDFTAQTDSEGRLWLYAGTDSGFEGRTIWFVTQLTARLSPTQ